MSAAPRISIVTPVYNPPVAVLRAMLDSVRAQTHADWEHCLVDDGSSGAGVVDLLHEVAEGDPRFRVHLRPKRGGIVAASNDGLAMARGEFVAFCDHDDELTVAALSAMVEHIDRHDDVDILYSDEDKIDLKGHRSDVFIKPAWSPDRMLGQMYTGHLTLVRRSLLEEVGGFRTGFDGAQDWDLMLRLTERARRIVHVPDVLYHWRSLEGSAASHSDAKPWAHEASARVLADYVQRAGIQADPTPVPGYPGHYWLRPALRDEPLVSVVIPTAGRSQVIDGTERPLVVNCVETLLRRSNYEHLEIVVVIDDHAPDGVRDQLVAVGGDRLRLVEFTQPFNFSAKVNVGVAASTGSMLLLLNDDIEVLPPAWHPKPYNVTDPLPVWPTLEGGALRTWIESMLVYALQPGVGAVGAKLFFPNGKLQHSGVIAKGGLVGHTYYGADGNQCGSWGNLIVPLNLLAVTAACLMIRRDVFDAVHGMDESLPVNYNDVDLCLRLHEAGYRNVLPPHVELLHRESASRGAAPAKPEEIAALQERWGDLLWNDPYYDPRFVDSDYGVSREHTPLALARRIRNVYKHAGPSGVWTAVRRKVTRTLDRDGAAAP